MEAAARLVASAGGRLDVMHGEAPLLPRRTGPGEVHFVGGAAGPLGGDRFRIDVIVGPDAFLVVRSVAATIALPGRTGALSQLEIHATVASGGRLDWRPEPLIAVRGCRHETLSTVDLAANAMLVWRDELVCGRYGEPSGVARLWTSVSRAGKPLYINDLTVGPGTGAEGPAILGGARVYGSQLCVPGTTAPKPTAVTAVLELDGPGTAATALGDDLFAVRRALAAPLAYARRT
jgi:urease accessory protein